MVDPIQIERESDRATQPAKIIDFMMEFLLHVVIFLVPLLFTSATVENFLTPKEYIIRTGAHFIYFLFVIKVCLSGRLRIPTDKISLVATALFVYCSSSLLWAVNDQVSPAILSQTSLRDVRDFLLVGGLFFLIRSNWSSRGFYLRILNTALLSAFVVALLAWMQSHNSYVFFGNQLKTPISRLNKSHTLLILTDKERRKPPLPLSTFFTYWWHHYFPEKGQPSLQQLQKIYGEGKAIGFLDLGWFSLRSTFDLLNWETPRVSAIISTFGNRNYLASFMAMMLFPLFSWWFFLAVGSHWAFMKKIPPPLHLLLRIIALVPLTIIILIFEYSVLATRSRGGMVALVAGFFFFIFAYFIGLFRELDFKKQLLRGAPLLGIFGLFLLLQIIPNPLSIHEDSLGNKFKTIGNTSTYNSGISNTLERLNVLRYTSTTITKSLKNLLLGVGFGQFRHTFPLEKARSMPEEIKAIFSEVTFRQAHNDWLQFMQEFGLIGILLFSLLVILVFKGGFTFLLSEGIESGDKTASYQSAHSGSKQHEEKLFLTGLLSALFCYLIVINFDFSHHQIANGFFGLLLFTIISQIVSSQFFNREQSYYLVSFYQHPLKIPLLFGLFPYNFHLIIASFLFMGSSLNFEHRRWQADILLKAGTTRIQAKKPKEAIALIRDALHKDPLLGDGWYRLSTACTSVIEERKNIIPAIKKAWSTINYNGRATYHSVIYQLVIYNHLIGKKAEAIKWAREGIRLTCGRARSPYHLILGKILFDTGKVKEARKHLEICLNLPQTKNQASFMLLNLYARGKEWLKAMKMGEETLSTALYKKNPAYHNILGVSQFNYGLQCIASDTLGFNGKTGSEIVRSGLSHLEMASLLLPGNYQLLRDYGVALAKNKDYSRAMTAFQKMLNIKSLPESQRGATLAFIRDCQRFLRQQGVALSSGTTNGSNTATAVKSVSKLLNSNQKMLIQFPEKKLLGVINFSDRKFAQSLKLNHLPDKILFNPVTHDALLFTKSPGQITPLYAPNYTASGSLNLPAGLRLIDGAIRRDSGRLVLLTENMAVKKTGKGNSQIFEISPNLKEDRAYAGQVQIQSQRILLLKSYPEDVFLGNDMAIFRVNMRKKQILGSFADRMKEFTNWRSNDFSGELFAFHLKKNTLFFLNPDTMKPSGMCQVPRLSLVSNLFIIPETGEIILQSSDKKIRVVHPIQRKIVKEMTTPREIDIFSSNSQGNFWITANTSESQLNLYNTISRKSEMITLPMKPGKILFLN